MKTRTGSTLANAVAASGMALLLAACGRGDGSSIGTLGLDVADVPADNAEGERIDINYFDELDTPETRPIDLLTLTGGATELLGDVVTLEASNYSLIRQKLNVGRGAVDPYVGWNGLHSLYVPRGAHSGLKLDHGYNEPDYRIVSFDTNSDLHGSVHSSSGLEDNYILRPTLRLVGGSSDGVLNGTVSGVENDPDCNDNVDYFGAVYVFKSEDVVDDVDGIGDPVTSARVHNDGTYAYTVAFLDEGDYSIAFTCDANIDDSGKDADIDITDGTMEFVGETVVTIMAGMTTKHDFQIPAP